MSISYDNFLNVDNYYGEYDNNIQEKILKQQIDNWNNIQNRRYAYSEGDITVGESPDYLIINPTTFSISTPYDNAIFKISSLPFLRKK